MILKNNNLEKENNNTLESLILFTDSISLQEAMLREYPGRITDRQYIRFRHEDYGYLFVFRDLRRDELIPFISAMEELLEIRDRYVIVNTDYKDKVRIE